MTENSERVVAVNSLTEFFRDEVNAAIQRRGIEAEDQTEHYVVNLLTVFARSDALYEKTEHGLGLKPLVFMLADAVEARSPGERNFALQRLGDVSLFIAGFFSDSLARSLVDVDYYVRMGGNAYGSLSTTLSGPRGTALAGTFAELAQKFQGFVDVLAEVRDSARDSSDQDLLRTYEIWLKTGSDRAKELLRSAGVEPNASLTTEYQH